MASDRRPRPSHVEVVVRLRDVDDDRDSARLDDRLERRRERMRGNDHSRAWLERSTE